VVCRGEAHLREELARVEGLGGEGLMVRQPASKYEAGRSATLLKVKNFHDSEAKVLEHVAGAGRHKGRLGALLVELPNGTRFNIGTGFSDAERENPPPVGAVVTFRYQELSDGGVPRFPSYVGVRFDVRWPRSDGAAKPASAKGAPAKPAPAPAPSPVVRAGKRRFEMTEGDTRYFWEIELTGSKHRVRFGTFDVKVKRFASEKEAEKTLEERIAEKLSKGFAEVDGEPE
jgi:DNA ligase-1